MSLQYIQTLEGAKKPPGFFRRLFGLRGPHGGHGGGHHHGGGGGGGHHHGGGGFYPSGRYWATGPKVVVVSGCPDIYAPVLGTDGQVYGNYCLAMNAGVGVVKGLSGPVDTAMAHPVLIGLGLAAGIFLGLRSAKRRR